MCASNKGKSRVHAFDNAQMYLYCLFGAPRLQHLDNIIIIIIIVNANNNHFVHIIQYYNTTSSMLKSKKKKHIETSQKVLYLLHIIVLIN